MKLINRLLEWMGFDTTPAPSVLDGLPVHEGDMVCRKCGTDLRKESVSGKFDPNARHWIYAGIIACGKCSPDEFEFTREKHVG